MTTHHDEVDAVANFMLIKEALQYTDYTAEHLRYLLTHTLITGKKIGGVWLVDLDSLKAYEQRMKEAGLSKFRPKSLDRDE
jgi:hypothetical protein